MYRYEGLCLYGDGSYIITLCLVQAYFLTLIVFCFTTEVKVLQDGNRNILNNVLHMYMH